MPSNDFKPFAVGGSASVVSQATYAAATTLLADGFQDGIADKAYLNKVWRQSSIMSATLGKLINDVTGANAVDDGTIATIEANLILAVQTLAAGIAASTVTVTTTGGTVTLSPTQAAAKFITITGVLASNCTIRFPNSVSNWFVKNNTTGAFTMTYKAVGQGGTGVVPAAALTEQVSCDATTLERTTATTVTQTSGNGTGALASCLYVDKAISEVGGYYQDTGAANAYVVATIPITTVLRDGEAIRFRAAHANTGASTLNIGTGAISLTKEGGGALQANDILNTYVISATYVLATNSWVVNGVVASDFLDSPAFRNNPTAPTQTLGDNTTKLATTAFVEAAVAARLPSSGYVAASTTFLSGDYLVDTTAGPFSCNVVGSPTLGDNFTIRDAAGTFAINKLTLTALGGKNFTSKGYTSSTFVCNTRGEDLQFWYDGTNWRIR